MVFKSANGYNLLDDDKSRYKEGSMNFYKYHDEEGHMNNQCEGFRDKVIQMMIWGILRIKKGMNVMQPYYLIVLPTFTKYFAYVLYIKCLDILCFMFWRHF